MKYFRMIQGVAVAIACLGFVAPQALMAQSPIQSSTPDIALSQGGVLAGQVVNAQGAARAGTPVSIVQNGVEVAKTVTDSQGRFVANGLRGGVYHLVTVNGQTMCRVWAEGTAPPAAQQGALLVAGDVVRGQGCDSGCATGCDSCGGGGCDACGGAAGGGYFGGGGMGGFLSNPWVLAGVVAAAIAIPIAVHDNNSSS